MKHAHTSKAGKITPELDDLFREFLKVGEHYAYLLSNEHFFHRVLVDTRLRSLETLDSLNIMGKNVRKGLVALGEDTKPLHSFLSLANDVVPYGHPMRFGGWNPSREEVIEGEALFGRARKETLNAWRDLKIHIESALDKDMAAANGTLAAPRTKRRIEKMKVLHESVRKALEDYSEECLGGKAEVSPQLVYEVIASPQNHLWPVAYPKPEDNNRWLRDIRAILKESDIRPLIDNMQNP